MGGQRGVQKFFVLKLFKTLSYVKKSYLVPILRVMRGVGVGSKAERGVKGGQKNFSS